MALSDVVKMVSIIRHNDRMEEIARERVKPRPRKKGNVDLEMTKL